METSDRDFLGTGWKFPLQVTPNGRMAMSSYEQRIEEAIYVTLATARGERPALPDFGCGIHDLAFEPNNVMTRSMVVNEVRNALVNYEPRIDVLDIHVDSSAEDDNVLLIRVDYRIRSSNTISNIVYPFFLKEGS